MASKERRKQILRSAIRVFAEHSYRGATTKMISQEANVAEALIYRHFKSKRFLFTEAVEHSCRRLVVEIERILEMHPDDPAAALGAVLEYYHELLERHQDFAKMIFWVSAELDSDDVREVYLPFQEQALELFMTAISGWQQQGLLREDVPPRAAAWMILGSYQVLALMKHSGKLEEVNAKAAVALMKPYLAVALTAK